MVKVIKEPPVYEADCPKCGALLGYRKNDIQHYEGHRGEKDVEYITCPLCSGYICLSREK